ncbi:MAG: DNA polymerase I [Pirellulaceae bacterium]|nr:MAG: DNA polymerase I [Pirellulaceae bacterium]
MPTGHEQKLLWLPDRLPSQPPIEQEAGDVSPSQRLPGGAVVWALDGHTLIYQAYHAMPAMTGPAGQPVGAIFGFCRDLLDLIQKHHPEYLVCVLDYSDVTFRNDILPSYKMHRPPMPENLRSQLEGIDRLLEAMGIVKLCVPNYEADDILATVARQVIEAGGQCVLVTSDKDCWQLVRPGVRLYRIRTGELLDAEDLRRLWGITPEQVVDFQALVGDSTDGIPGVPTVGQKTASEWLKRYGTLENLYAHVDELKPNRQRESLIQHREQAFLSRQLARLDDHVPIQLDWEAIRLGRYRFDQIEQFCREFGFRQFAERFEQLRGKAARPAQQDAIGVEVVTTPEQLDRLVERIASCRCVSIDLETTSLHPRQARIVGIAVATGPQAGYYLPIRAPHGSAVLEEALVLERLRPVLEDPGIAKVGQNIKYDAIVLRSAGIQPRGWQFDTMVADYLLEPGQRNHSLDDLARRYLNHKTIRIETLIGRGAKQIGMDEVAVADVARYAVEDVVLPLRLKPLLEERLKNAQLQALFQDLEMPLVEVLVEMEFRGIRVDVERLHRLSAQLAERLAALEREIHQLAGETFNVDSPRQLADVLFTRLKLPVHKRTRSSGPSTDVEVLESLAPLHPLPAKVLEYRQLAKLKGTYVDALPALVHPATGRIHTSFKQDVAATGRLSSQEPNLQNIPVRTVEGREIREAFVPEEGWLLLSADYSQIELRLLAHFCEDPALLEAFARDEDIHTRVAAEVFGVAPDQVTSEQRRRAKAVNFGIIYGQTPFGLARSLGISKEDAAAFIDAYFARYPRVLQFIDKTLDQCRTRGYVSTILGRRRQVQGIRSPGRRSDGSRTLPERIAVNTVIQGSAADLIKLAMVRIHRRLKQEGWAAAMLLQIHDELVFEVPPEEHSRLAAMVADEMTHVLPLSVPLKVDVHSGKNWAECQ